MHNTDFSSWQGLSASPTTSLQPGSGLHQSIRALGRDLDGDAQEKKPPQHVSPKLGGRGGGGGGGGGTPPVLYPNLRKLQETQQPNSSLFCRPLKAPNSTCHAWCKQAARCNVHHTSACRPNNVAPHDGSTSLPVNLECFVLCRLLTLLQYESSNSRAGRKPSVSARHGRRSLVACAAEAFAARFVSLATGEL